jgi:polyisoprenoid-binding protein YceI
MTIKGISKELEFPIKIEGRDGDMKVTGDIVFDRSLFDIKYPSVGNYAAKNEIKLKLNISSKI